MGYNGNSEKSVSSSYLFTQLQLLYTKIKGLLSTKADISHTHSYLSLSGGTLTGKLTMKGSTNIEVRHLEGSVNNGMDGNLYLNYTNSSRPIYIGRAGYSIYNNGANYSGTSAYASNSNQVDGFDVVLNNGYGLKPIGAGTTALNPGVTPMTTGYIYIQYE